MIPFILLSLLVIPTVFISLYLLLLLLLSFKASDQKSNTKKSFFKSVAIIIPAHNEEESIAETIKSCRELEYPSNKYDIIVVADNCKDDTAELSEKNGAIVFERNDTTAKGKGHALKWAFEKLIDHDYEAYLVLDADCSISKNGLQKINYHLTEGKKVLQLNDLTSNPDESPLSYTLAIGNFIENHLFYAPKSKLNLAVFLRGTGMVFSKDILDKYPWEATSIAEDTDYSIKLISNNIPIYFIETASVVSPFPTNINQLNTQRDRWAGGNIALSKNFALKMLFEGIGSGNLRLSDAGWTLLINSKPLLLGYQALVILLSLSYYLIIPGILSYTLFCIAIYAGIVTIIYFILGIIRMGITRKRISLMIQSPVWIFNIFRITFRSFFSKNVQVWKKTPR